MLDQVSIVYSAQPKVVKQFIAIEVDCVVQLERVC